MTTMASAPSSIRYQGPKAESWSCMTKNTMTPTIGPSIEPMPPMTTMKITIAVQSSTEKAASGEMRAVCR